MKEIATVPDARSVLLGDLVRPGALTVVAGAVAPDRIRTLARLVGSGGAVHVFEWNPVAAAALGGVLTVAEAAVVRVIPAALGAVTGRDERVMASRYDVRPGRSCRAARNARPVAVHASCVRLDDYLADADVHAELVLIENESIDAALSGAPQTIKNANSIWLGRCQASGMAPQMLQGAGYRLFDTSTCRLWAGDTRNASFDLLAIAAGAATRHGRWRQPPVVTAFHDLALEPAPAASGASLATPFAFLPAGRWLLNVAFGATASRRLRAAVVDAEGRTLATDPCSRVHTGRVRVTQMVELDASRAVQVVVTAQGLESRLHAGRVTLEEVRFS